MEFSYPLPFCTLELGILITVLDYGKRLYCRTVCWNLVFLLPPYIGYFYQFILCFIIAYNITPCLEYLQKRNKAIRY